MRTDSTCLLFEHNYRYLLWCPLILKEAFFNVVLKTIYAGSSIKVVG